MSLDENSGGDPAVTGASEMAGQAAGKNTPSRLRRRDVVFWAVLLSAGVGLGIYLHDGNHATLVKSIAAPRIGDVYLADLSRMAGGYKNYTSAYGAMRLVGMDDQGRLLQFNLAKSGWNNKKGLYGDVISDRVKKKEYYDEHETIEFTPQELTDFVEKEVIFKIIH